jgi:antitoxin CptB
MDVTETEEARLKRLAMRSWRRGMKETDLILGPYADAQLAEMGAAELDLYEALLSESDPDVLGWVLGQAAVPARFAGLIGEIAGFAKARLSGSAAG